MNKILIYDCEIIKCIPPKDGSLDPKLEYCQGWHDFENMGVSVIGVAEGLDVEPRILVWESPEARNLFVELTETADTIIGFNSHSFDDRLMAANKIQVRTTYDLLVEIRIGGYGSPAWQDQPAGWSYSLDAIARANGLAKTGSGALAPELWQQGKRQEVINYCLHDIRITQALLKLGLDGALIDPNTGCSLQLPPLEVLT